MISDRASKVEDLRDIIKNFMNLSYTLENKEKAFEVIESMKDFNLEFLPYSAITEIVYRYHIQNMRNKEERAHEKLNNFLSYYSYNLKKFEEEKIRIEGEKIYSEHNEIEKAYKVAIKIYEHLELAQQQLDSLFSTHEQKISEMEEAISKVEKLQEDNQELTSRLENLEKEMTRATSSYISILGIFAAILLGAFGAMQGFTSLFNNIDKTTIGNLVIISGLSGLVVVSILYILIFSLAKLTGKNLKSNNEATRIVFQYPLISITFLILLIILTSGIAIELSFSEPITLDSSLFWIMPILLSIVLVYVTFRKRH